MELYHEEKASVKELLTISDLDGLRVKASEGLLSLSLQLGIDVLQKMMEADVTEVAGEKGKHCTERSAYRHGYEQTKVVLGGEKISTKRPRVRSKGGEELPLPTLEIFQRENELNRTILTQLLAGVSTRKYERVEKALNGGCTGKSEVSRRFIQGMKAASAEFFSRSLDEDFFAVMLDGMGFSDITVIAAMGITTDGRKKILGLAEGGSENTEVVTTLLSDLVARGIKKDKPYIFVLDGGKALHKGVVNVFGKNACIQRCQVHKKRNVLAKLPQSEQANTALAISNAYCEFEYTRAKTSLEKLASELEFRYPNAAASLREGLEETLTVHKLKVPGLLRQTLATTNPMESANSVCAGVIRRVSKFKDGETAMRHAAAGFMEAEKSFRRIKGYQQIPFLLNALESLTSEQKSGILIA